MKSKFFVPIKSTFLYHFLVEVFENLISKNNCQLSDGFEYVSNTSQIFEIIILNDPRDIRMLMKAFRGTLKKFMTLISLKNFHKLVFMVCKWNTFDNHIQARLWHCLVSILLIHEKIKQKAVTIM